MGQAKKFTDIRIKLFMEGVSKNLSTLLCCKYAGISKTLWYSWLQDEREKGEKSDYYGLQALHDKAYADGAVYLLGKLKVASDNPKYWNAAVWLLERNYKEHYGNQDTAPANQINIQLDEATIKDRIKDAIKAAKDAGKNTKKVADKKKAKS